MQSQISSLKGVIPPVITPFKENGDVDFDAFVYNIKKWNSDKLAGYLIIGSNSETVYLTRQEKLQLIQIAVAHKAPDRHILAGTGCESLRETIEFTKACADQGAQSALVLTPHYYDGAMTSKILINFFSKLADVSPIPILIYNVPKFTHVNIKEDAIEILSKHKNIVGMKDSTGNVPQLANFLNIADENFQIFVGTASAWYPALTMGIKAGIMALANCNPNECALVQDCFDQGHPELAFKFYQTMLAINTAVTAQYSIPGLKVACNLSGYQGGSVREPLMDCSEEDKVKISELLATVKDKIKILY